MAKKYIKVILISDKMDYDIEIQVFLQKKFTSNISSIV